MFTPIKIQITFKGRTFYPGDSVNMGKIPGLAEAIERATKKKPAVGSPQNKMVDTDELQKG